MENDNVSLAVGPNPAMEFTHGSIPKSKRALFCVKNYNYWGSEMKAYLHSKNIRADGTMDCLHSFTVDAKESPLWWQERGLSYTASGYGKRIPTPYMVLLNGKWRRVYCCIFSNSGTLYIGDFFKKTGEVIIVGDIA